MGGSFSEFSGSGGFWGVHGQGVLEERRINR